MSETFSKILVSGGAGFIGSHFTRQMLAEDPGLSVVVYDKLTYAGNLENLEDVADDPRYSFVRGDIADEAALTAAAVGCDAIVNFAAETHVDRSIVDPEAFLDTDVKGTYRLMAVAKALGVRKVVQVSTDEVYGDVEEGHATEEWPLAASSPYSASKAAGDLLSFAFHRTYGVPVCISRGSNTYGPNQYPEKLIPLFVTNALSGEPLPLYGDGLQRRDWLHVTDHARGVAAVLASGEPGQAYNIGGGNERTNREITDIILRTLDLPDSVIKHVEDRPGHDRRYALDATKARGLGWAPRVPFEEGIVATVEWYRDNPGWWQRIKDGTAFKEWHTEWYAERR
jgi:dTDP-glucose 4,6-dehydratase